MKIINNYHKKSKLIRFYYYLAQLLVATQRSNGSWNSATNVHSHNYLRFHTNICPFTFEMPPIPTVFSFFLVPSGKLMQEMACLLNYKIKSTLSPQESQQIEINDSNMVAQVILLISTAILLSPKKYFYTSSL